MFHIPTKEYTNNALHYVTYRKLAPPMHLPLPTEPDITVLGKTDRRGAEK
jgi:hypothetical protein